ncbi:uncharacterized protein PG998_006921 [Apiospora kogelbergensis]|uniref:uncharacterized protein n=1 Tax=Apiospora kogelbergensis TaxID=1337665 RepID=UPI00312F772D
MGAKYLLRACALASLGAIALSKPVAPVRSAAFLEAQKLADPSYGPVPGQDPIFNTYWGKAPTPHPAYQEGPPGVDDQVWQNLLAAEWIIFEFYQQAVEMFNESSFIAAGMPNTTYERVKEIRNNEAGHLRIFQNQISETSVKPGACKYQFPYKDPQSFLALGTVLEISSMAFLTGLVQQVKLNTAKGAMLAIAETETRHEVWALMDIWKVNPLGGPSDTVFPYANEVLGSTGSLVVPGSCPKENPEYPSPNQHLPNLGASKNTKSLAPGSTIDLAFGDPTNQPKFAKGKQYYAVFFHGVANISVPIETCDWPQKNITVTIPPQFEEKGVIAAVVADTPGAPTKETVIAGPGIILEQPEPLGVKLL